MEKLLEQQATPLTRRKVVATGVKIGYAAPLVAASFKLAGGRALAEEWVWMDVIPLATDDFPSYTVQCKVIICHATCSESGGNTGTGYSAIEIPGNCDEPDKALAAHLAKPGHQNGCQDGRHDVFPEEVTEDKKQAKCPGGGVIQSLPTNP